MMDDLVKDITQYIDIYNGLLKFIDDNINNIDNYDNTMNLFYDQVKKLNFQNTKLEININGKDKQLIINSIYSLYYVKSNRYFSKDPQNTIYDDNKLIYDDTKNIVWYYNKNGKPTKNYSRIMKYENLTYEKIITHRLLLKNKIKNKKFKCVKNIYKYCFNFNECDFNFYDENEKLVDNKICGIDQGIYSFPENLLNPINKYFAVTMFQILSMNINLMIIKLKNFIKNLEE